MEGANTKEPLFDECILSMAGVHRQIVNPMQGGPSLTNDAIASHDAMATGAAPLD